MLKTINLPTEVAQELTEMHEKASYLQIEDPQDLLDEIYGGTSLYDYCFKQEDSENVTHQLEVIHAFFGVKESKPTLDSVSTEIKASCYNLFRSVSYQSKNFSLESMLDYAKDNLPIEDSLWCYLFSITTYSSQEILAHQVSFSQLYLAYQQEHTNLKYYVKVPKTKDQYYFKFNGNISTGVVTQSGVDFTFTEAEIKLFGFDLDIYKKEVVENDK